MAKSALLSEPAIEHEGAFVHVVEVSEVLVIHEPIETAFPLHTPSSVSYLRPPIRSNDWL
jgi:hypothetical protein